MPIKNKKEDGFTPLEARRRRRPTVAFGNSLAGFTLLEIMVAMIILAILAAGFFNTMVSSRYLVARSKRRFMGDEIARQEIENKRQYIRWDLWQLNNADNPLWPNGSWTDWTNVANYPGYQSRFKVENIPGAECRKITVQVSWNETGV